MAPACAALEPIKAIILLEKQLLTLCTLTSSVEL